LSEVPSLSYLQIVRTLQRFGFVIVRQRGSHIRLQKRLKDKTLRITVPAHKPVHAITLRNILKQAEISIIQFKEYL
jgi:predicted RNA binding protein YcfA (HicA-like mRNA interferase family)